MPVLPWQGRTTICHGRVWRALSVKTTVAGATRHAKCEARTPLVHTHHVHGHAGILKIQHCGTWIQHKRVRRFKVVRAASEPDPSSSQPTPSSPPTKPPPAILRPLIALWESLHGVVVFIASVLDRWYIKAVLFMTLFCVGLSLLIKACLVPYVNRSVLPFACEKAAELLQREVRIGELEWVSLGGLSGLHPLASISDVYVGPALDEHSSLKAQQVVLSVDAIQTMLSKQITCKVHASGIELLLVQGSNFTWFGFPRDNDIYHEVGPAAIKPPDHPSFGQPNSNHSPPSPALLEQLPATLDKSVAAASYDGTHDTLLPAGRHAAAAPVRESQSAMLFPVKTASRWQQGTLPVASISSNIPGGGNNNNNRSAVDSNHHNHDHQSSGVGREDHVSQPGKQNDHITPTDVSTNDTPQAEVPGVSDPEPPINSTQHLPATNKVLPETSVDSTYHDHDQHLVDDAHPSDKRHGVPPFNHQQLDIQPEAVHHLTGNEGPWDASIPSAASHPIPSSPPTPTVAHHDPRPHHSVFSSSDESHSTDMLSEPVRDRVLKLGKPPTPLPPDQPTTGMPVHPQPGQASQVGEDATSSQAQSPSAIPVTSQPSAVPQVGGEADTRQETEWFVQGSHNSRVNERAPDATSTSRVNSPAGLNAANPAAVSASHGSMDRADSGLLAAPSRSATATTSPSAQTMPTTHPGMPASHRTQPSPASTATTSPRTLSTPASSAAAVWEPSAAGPESTSTAKPGRRGIRIFGRRLVAERALKQRLPAAKMEEGWEQQEERDAAEVNQAYRSLLEPQTPGTMQPVVEDDTQGEVESLVNRQAEEDKPAAPQAPVKPQGLQAIVEDKVKEIAEIVAPVPKEVLPPLAIVTMAKYMVARVLESWQPPTVAVSRISLSGGTLVVYMEGEGIPRVVEDVEASCKFGRDYHWIDADVSGRARARDPLLDKCTMISPKAKRHLRHVTAGAQVGKVRIFQNDELPHDLTAELREQLWPPTVETAADLSAGAHIESGIKAEAVFNQVHVQSSPIVSKPTKRKDSVTGPEGAPSVGGANPVWTSSVQGALGDVVAPELEKGHKHILINTYKILDRTKLTPQQVVKLGWKAPPAATNLAPAPATEGQPPVPAKGSGGDVKVRLTCRNIMVPDRWPDLQVSIKGDNLHGPMIERIIKLPMDIYEGRADGELRIKAFDEETWNFPHFHGKVHCKDVDLHFWDAPDDIHSATMDLLFEKDRMYLHGASGYFGAVPLTVTGDMDLNPDTGTYRLSASVAPVEINALRASLGVRPIPYPCVGGVRGVLHCTGPLEYPLFSGTAVAVRPSADTLAAGEDSAALEALKSTPGAVAAYDKIPVVSASGVFTMDMSSKMFMLHSGHAQPVGGGQLIANGRMWVADEAEEDPRAVRMQGEGQGLDADLLLQHYLPAGVTLPSSIRMGAINVKGTMEGSHVSPVVRVRWDAPTSAITGSAMLSRPLVQASSSGPHFQVAASLTQSFPGFEQMKMANTQAEATLYGTPLITGCDLESSVAGLDLLQMASSPAPATRMSSGVPVRLKVAASTSLSVRLQDENEPLSFAGTIQLADVRLNQLSLARSLSGHLQLCPSALNITARGLRPDELLDVHLSLPQTAEQVSGPLAADQETGLTAGRERAVDSELKLSSAMPSQLETKQAKGSGTKAGTNEQSGDERVSEQMATADLQDIAVGERAGTSLELVSDHGAERGGNEGKTQGTVDVDVAIDGKDTLIGAETSSAADSLTTGREGAGLKADATPASTGEQVSGPTAPSTSGAQAQPAYAIPGTSSASQPGMGPAVAPDGTAVAASQAAAVLETPSSNSPAGTGGAAPPDGGPASNIAAPAAPSGEVEAGQKAEQASTAAPAAKAKDSSFVLRRGPLLVSARVNSEMNCGALRLAGMTLDELELASLRGQVGELEVEVDLPKQSGHAHVYIDSPRYSGLQGVGFSSHVRWDGSVLRLEQAVLQQKHSRYEVRGEYILPPNTTFPDTAMFTAPTTEGSEDGNDPSAEQTGFWRVMLTVPQAELEEILPAARLLRRATSVQPSDYNTAKREFLSQMGATSIEAPQLLPQVRALSVDGQVSKEPDWDRSPSPRPPTASPNPKSVLPGLQELRGRWSGSVQAVGGAGGATSVNFSVKGQNWKWGSFGLDQVVVAGTAHESEGVQLDELVLRSGEARLSVHGSLLSPKQDATIMLHDFPVAMLHPLYRALPALQNAAPAVTALPKKSGNVGNVGPLSAMSQRLEQTMGNLMGKLGGGNTDVASWAGSPINGQLELKGTLGGSASAPEGQLKVRLYDGAIGAVRLARAEAEMGINHQQQLSMEVDLVPAESAGHLKMVGRMPLLPLSKATSSSTAANGGPAEEDSMDVRVSVRDGGMSLVTSISPDVCWVGGNAAIELSMRGSVVSPQVQGSATLSKASITSPYLKYPVTNVGGTIKVQGSTLSAENLEARVGRQGHVRIKGDLPLSLSALKTNSLPPSPGKKGAVTSDGLSVDIGGLELRIRNMFTGSVDAKLQLLRSVDSPRVAGSVRFSKGTAYLIPQGGTGPAAPINPEGGASERDMVAKAFAALKAGKLRSALAEAPVQAPGELSPEAPPSAPPTPPLTNLYLDNLTVALGPEMRAVFPLVINVGVSGEVELMGPADPAGMKVKGMFKLENGVINLVATQFNLDRDHPNTITFVPERSLDPEIDVCLLSSDLRCQVQGSSSSWQDHVVLTHRGGGPGTPGEGERVDPEEVARIFEGRLAETLLAEDGQLAFSNLASSTFSTLLPKIETHGQLGKARWRLVSALPIPGLLSLEPSGDATNLLSTLTMGTEVEIQFGKSVQAAMAYKAREAEGSGTEWTLIYQISSKLRLQAHLKSHNPLPTILLQYSSEATTR